jgi:hypothetical protein
MDFLDNLILIGCADGRLEFWEGTTGSIKCIYENQTTYSNGVTNIKLAGDKLIVARLNGRLDFLRLETFIFFSPAYTNYLRLNYLRLNDFSG